MLKIFIFILLMSSSAFATLTVDNIPRTKTGGSSPSIQDSNITSISGGNIGIGSTSPGKTLDVQGTVRASSNVLVQGNLGVGSSTPQSALDVSGSVTIHGGSSLMQFSTNGETFTNNTDGYIASSGGLTTGGNVGVNSATPGTTLDVTGTTRTTGLQLSTNPSSGYVLVSGSTGIGTWMSPSSIGAGGGSGTINSGTTNRHARYTAATTLDSSALIFDDATNIGIGTIAPRSAVEIGIQVANVVGSNLGIGSTAPGTKLDVQGTIRVSSDVVIGANSVCQSNGTNCPASGSSQWLTHLSVGIGTYDNVGIGTITPSAGRLVVTGGNVGIGTATPQGALTVTSGNVGIGTWAPLASLSIGAGSAFRVSSAGIITRLNNIASTGLSDTTLDLNTSTAVVNNNLSSGILSLRGGQTTGQLTFYTAGAEVARINAAGNLGIGSNAPGYKLDVNGGIRSIVDDLGWSVVDQTDNQACTTGCASACVFGIQNATGTAVTSLVSCSDATADLCLCAGAS